MKKISTTVLAMFAITGLCLAGSETNNLTTQVFACTGGVMLFAASMWTIAMVNRG